MARTEGSNPTLIPTTTGWDLYVNGVRVMTIDNKGSLRLLGDISTNENI